MIARIKKTGELIDVRRKSDGWVRMTEPMDWVRSQEFDLLGYTLDEVQEIKAHARQPDTSIVDWEQRRYEAARDICVALLIGKRYERYDDGYPRYAKEAVACADELIKVLKKN